MVNYFDYRLVCAAEMAKKFIGDASKDLGSWTKIVLLPAYPVMVITNYFVSFSGLNMLGGEPNNNKMSENKDKS